MKVLGVLGGRPPAPVVLQSWAKAADRLYAADSGAEPLLALGLHPVVTGDIDSVTADLSLLRVVPDLDPDRSDCDKLLDLVHAEVPAPDLVLAGLEGDRLDHMLASLSSVFASRLSPRILLDTGVAYPLRSGQTLALPDADGLTFSLIPLADCIATLQNCLWPLDQKHLSFGTFHSLSNQALPGFQVVLHQGQALLVVTGPQHPW